MDIFFKEFIVKNFPHINQNQCTIFHIFITKIVDRTDFHVIMKLIKVVLAAQNNTIFAALQKRRELK